VDKIITPGDSLRGALLCSAAPAFGAVSIIWFVFRDAPWFLNLAIPTAAFGFLWWLVYKSVYENVTIPWGHEGVPTIQGKIVAHETLTMGDHPKLKGYESAKPVKMLGEDIDPSKIEQPARNNVEVAIEASFVLTVIDKIKYLTTVSNPEELIKDGFEACLSAFVGKFEFGENLNKFQDIIREYMQLGSKGFEASSEYDKVRIKLMTLTLGTTPDLLPESVVEMMDGAGAFSKKALEYGMQVTAVKVTSVDEPSAVKAAANARAAEKDIQAQKRLRALFIQQIAEEYTKPPFNLEGADAVTQASLIEGLVTKNVEEIRLPDLKQVAADLGPEAAELLTRVITRRGNKK
jgi:regulator of protease activity HflC (stomatin/prohibitin superfamily)